MKVKCKHCGQDYEVDESMTGKNAECGACANNFVITPLVDEPEAVSPVSVLPETETEGGELILGLYRRTGEFADGGMARVSRVYHTTWNVDLAMKQPHAGLFESEADKENFSHECAAWINLGLHPHIVSCYYVREVDGIPSIFAEWMDGGSLTNWIEDGRLDSLEKILDVAIQFAWGLDYAHEQGLIHQDIKPQNVLLTAESDVKIADFGIANAKMDLSKSGSTSTGFNGTMFSEAGFHTKAYAAPEQIAGGRLTRRTDIFSWAVSMVEILIGGCCWKSSSVVQEEFDTYLDSAVVPVPDSLKKLLRECLTEKESERPHDCKIITDQLLKIYQTETGEKYSREAPKSAADSPNSLNNRALSYIDMGQPGKAERFWEQALKIDKLHLESTYNQGLYLRRHGRIDDMELVRRLEAVRQGYSGSWRDEYLLAMIHIDRVDAKSALPLLESASKQSNNAPEVLRAMKIAENLRGKGECIRIFEGHENGVTSVSFSPDGRFALSGSHGKAMKLWDMETGKCIRTFKGHTGGVNSVSFSPDGKFALSGSSSFQIKKDCFSSDCLSSDDIAYSGEMKLWNVATGECIRTFGHKDAVTSVTFGTNGRFALSGGDAMKLWDVASGKCLHTFEGNENGVTSVTFSPDGRFALSGSYDKTMKLWDVTSGKCLRLFEGHTDRVRSVCFSPNGRFAISGGAGTDNTLKLWDVETGECLRTFEGCEPVTFSPDGKFALSGGNSMKLWDVASGECIRTFAGHTRSINSVCFSPDGKFALSGSDDMKLWNVEHKCYSDWELCRIQVITEIIGQKKHFNKFLEKAEKQLHNSEIANALNILNEARKVPGFERVDQVLDLNGKIGKYCRIANLNLTWEINTFEGHKGWIESVNFSPDGRLALSGSDDMKLWDVETCECLPTFKEYKKYIKSVSFSPDGRFALSGSYDKTMKLWDVDTGECLRMFEEHKNKVNSVSFSPDGKFVLSGSGSDGNGELKLWDVVNGECLRTFSGNKGEICSVSFSPDGKFALSGGWSLQIQKDCFSSDGKFAFSGDSTMKLWDVASGECIRTFGHKDAVYSVSFSPDGRFALSGSDAMRLWDVASGECIRTFIGYVNSVCFSPNGKFALSGGNDQTMKLWDVNTGECLRSFEGHKSRITSVCFSPDGNSVLSGSWDKTIRLWQLDWKYEFPGWADRDDGAEPYLRIFLTLHPKYTEADVQKLLTELQYRGYGWLRPEGVRKKLEEMTLK